MLARPLIISDGIRIQAPADATILGSHLPLPQPRVLLSHLGTPHDGFTRGGSPIQAYGEVVIKIADLPERYRLNPNTQLVIELLRNAPGHKKRRRDGTYEYVPAGFRHPSPWIKGAVSPGRGRTRGGGGGGPVDRPTEWNVAPTKANAGLRWGGSVILRVADVLAPWFELTTVTDINGGTVNSLGYFIGNNKRPGTRGVISYNHGPLLGVFAFRYAIIDETTGLNVTSPMSHPIFVRPRSWPTRYDPAGADPSRPKTHLVRGQTPGMTELVARLGSRLGIGNFIDQAYPSGG